jgi:fluoride exporter
VITAEHMLAAGFGGFFGACSRYILSVWATGWLTNLFGRPLPYGTMAVNLIGSFLLTVFLVWASQRVALSENLRVLVAIGFFGSFTTFSTFAYESIALMQAGYVLAGIGNIVLMNGLCLLGIVAGLMLANH